MATERVPPRRSGATVANNGASEVEVHFRVPDERSPGGTREFVLQWPLRTLIAFVAFQRDADEVADVLARGDNGHGVVTWKPVTVSPADVIAIETTFPLPLPEPETHLDLSRVIDARLVIPMERAIVSVPIAPIPELIDAVVHRARYAGFEYGYGAWADRYDARLNEAEALAFLATVDTFPVRQGLALAEKLGVEPPADLHHAPELRPGVRRLVDTWRYIQWRRHALDWTIELASAGLRQLGSGIRFFIPRENEDPPWGAGWTLWSGHP